MNAYRNPLPAGVDPTSVPVADKLEYMRQLKEDRRNKGIAIPRFVRALNKAGYAISVSDYKRCEQHPGNALDHIDEYLLVFAYDVLNSVRVQNSVQGPHTSRVMTLIAEKRVSLNLDYHDMSGKLNSRGVQMTEAEYRTAEQGMTKHVPFEVIAECMRILSIHPSEVFQ